MSFPAHQAIPQVRNSFPTPTRPWELSGPLQERVRKAPMQENSTYKKCLLLFSDLEWTSVNTYYVAEEPDTYVWGQAWHSDIWNIVFGVRLGIRTFGVWGQAWHSDIWNIEEDNLVKGPPSRDPTNLRLTRLEAKAI